MKILERFLYKNKDNKAINVGKEIVVINTYETENKDKSFFINTTDLEGNELELKRILDILNESITSILDVLLDGLKSKNKH